MRPLKLRWVCLATGAPPVKRTGDDPSFTTDVIRAADETFPSFASYALPGQPRAWSMGRGENWRRGAPRDLQLWPGRPPLLPLRTEAATVLQPTLSSQHAGRTIVGADSPRAAGHH